jgi:predicted alpha/beta hydrolase
MALIAANVQQDSLFIPARDGSRLHIRRIRANEGGPAVLMVHGAVANARTFYSEKGRGLGPWIAARGYDVFVLDLRGRGASAPLMGRGAAHGQTESICEDIPAALAEICRLRGEDVPIHLVGHSWGGVLISAVIAREPKWIRQVRSSVYFGSKRSIQVWNWPRIYEIDIFWSGIATILSMIHGYLPAQRYGIGADGETPKSLRQSQRWVRTREWRDSDDGFDYRSALSAGVLPPTLYLVGGNDPARGHPHDVRRFIAESGPHAHEFVMLDTTSGYSHDYGHIDMLTHSQAESDVFPLVEAWFVRHQTHL